MPGVANMYDSDCEENYEQFCYAPKSLSEN